MSGGISKLGEALTMVFVVSMVALFLELLYVLWRRRLLRRQSSALHGDSHPVGGSRYTSKELLYFFCLKAQSRVEPAGAPDSQSGALPADERVEVIDVFKLQEMYGPSRVLFTIKEEEREDLESVKSLPAAEMFFAGGAPEVTVDVETMPFSTPCGSPLYYTPAASPAREIVEYRGS